MEFLSSLLPVIQGFWYIILFIIGISFAVGIKKNKFTNLTKNTDNIMGLVHTLENSIINIKDKIEEFAKYEHSIEKLKNDSNYTSTQILLMENTCSNKCELFNKNLKYIAEEIEKNKKQILFLTNELKEQSNKLLIAQYEIVNNLKDTMKEALHDVIKRDNNDKR